MTEHYLITPDVISFRAQVGEDELRKRMAHEVLAQINGLDEDGKPCKGIHTKITRGSHGGYTIEVSGPVPAQILLPKG